MFKVYVRDHSGHEKTIETTPGEKLRDLLIENKFSPYATMTNSLNCGGNGICATCGVFVKETITPIHWHDKLANQFSYP
jgi:ferredoxin